MGKKGIFGGTFDVVHDGHRALLHTAFKEGDSVLIGVTSDEKANASRDRDVASYDERVERLRDECKTFANIHEANFTIERIVDNYKKAIETDADFIVLSPERKTHERAAKINLERIQNEKDRLQIIEAPMVTDYKDRKISSTRIRNGEIDVHGEEV
jgi:pantetheine-phosphate adenylyltransferase